LQAALLQSGRHVVWLSQLIFCLHYTHSYLTTMDLFAFPIEIRLKIHSELLVHHGPINFPATFGSDLSFRLCPEGIDLCPTLLCTSQQAYGEATLLLYSDNYFHFSTTWRRHDAIRPSLPSFGRSGLKQVSSATSTLAFLLPRWQKILGMILERIR